MEESNELARATLVGSEEPEA